MLVGLIWGMVIPASPFPRLALGAHLQLTTHDVMFLVAGLVILHLPFAKEGTRPTFALQLLGCACSAKE
jgi:hypothetical protein